MQQSSPVSVQTTFHQIHSHCLGREVTIDVYGVQQLNGVTPHLLLLNDGQDLHQIRFGAMLQALLGVGLIQPLVCVGIYAGTERLQEYGVAGVPDYAGRGATAAQHHQFVLEELLPFTRRLLGVAGFASVGYSGFSLGGLSALDAVWQHPEVFSLAGAFSASFWWRSRSLDDGYTDEQHRIMHQQVRQKDFQPGLRFYFTTGSLDETADRNGNGIIDSIDDTTDLVNELAGKGYVPGKDICYINYEEGRHDVASWGRALPGFLLWGWGRGEQENR